MEYLILAVLLGLIPGEIMRRKGYPFGPYWLVGALLFIVALPAALMAKPNPETRRQCPACKSSVPRDATACAHCARALTPDGAAVAVAPSVASDNTRAVVITVCVIAAVLLVAANL